MQAYKDGRYEDSLAFYGSLVGSNAADQPRVLNGVYLAYWRLGWRNEMRNAFTKIVIYAMAHEQLGIIFEFKLDQPVLRRIHRTYHTICGWT